MSDLIRRADAIKAIEDRIEDKYNRNDYEFGRNQAFEVAIVELEDLPTIDAVEVVHCKDCSKRHGEIQNCKGELLYYFCENGTHKPNWFCADGDVKNNGKN